jgi:ABC-2 type transport system ATP-binding protein
VSERAIEVRELHRSYGDVEAVGGIDLDVGRGEVFALLGPNGAGKTTTVEILEGYRDRSAGEVAVLGHDPSHAGRDLKARIGIVLQSTGVERYLTARETVEAVAGSYPRPRPVDEVLEVVGLRAQADVLVRRLSGGQRRRLDVAVALVGGPELLFLDEPTTGFDPAARRGAWEMLRGLAGRGTTIFLTTHLMDEAQALADRVAVIVAGRIVAEGAPGSLGGRDRMLARVRFRPPADAPPPPDWGQVALSDGSFELRTDDPTTASHRVTTWALEGGLRLEAFEVTQPSLEDVYLELTGRGEGEA